MSTTPASAAQTATAALPRKRRQILLPYQQAWINDESPRKLGDKSRRTGWTYVEAFDCVSRRFRRTRPRECNYWFSSADDSAAQEFIDYCRFWAKELFGRAADVFTEGVEDPATRRLDTSYCIRAPRDFKITAMTSNPRRFRSKGGDVCLDEFAFHDDPRGMYTAASPVTTWGGGLRLFSTPNGEGSEFNKFALNCKKVYSALDFGNWTVDGVAPATLGIYADAVARRRPSWDAVQAKARELRITPVFSYHRVTILDAVDQGMVELMNDTRGTTWTREAFLADCREKSLDEESYAQEYLCVPGMDASAWLTYQMIESCEHEACPRIDADLVPLTGGRVVAGIDVGRKKDLTVLWIAEQLGDVLWTRQVMRLAKTPIPDQIEILATALRNAKCRTTLVDYTGIGVGLCEGLQRKVGGVQDVTFTPAAKQAIAVDLRKAFEDRSLRVPANDSSLRESLHKVRKSVSPTGVIRFEAPRDDAGHSDEFWALGLCVHAAASGSGSGLCFIDHNAPGGYAHADSASQSLGAERCQT